MGEGMAPPGVYPHVAGESDTTVSWIDSGFESEGLSVRGGEVRPFSGTEEEGVGCAAKKAANPVGRDGWVMARNAG
jgi:hypothetical protein